MELEELEEQLNRCQKWLEEEPNDKEVRQKAIELQIQINNIKSEQSKIKNQKEIEERKNYLIELRKNIQKLEKRLRAEPVFIEGFTKECYSLEMIHKDTLKAQLYAKQQEFETLAVEYKELLGIEI